MALSRSMKNLMHDSAQARRGGGNPNPTGGRMNQYSPGRKRMLGGNRGPQAQVMPTGGTVGRQALMKAKMQQMRQRGGGGGMLRPAVEPPTRGPGTVAGKPMPRGGMMRPAVQPPQRGPGTVAGKPMPPGGTFGFASRGGGGTPALQQATAGSRMQATGQRTVGPAAFAQPPGQAVAQRVAGRQGPPARRGGMAQALGSGGSRRRLLR